MAEIIRKQVKALSFSLLSPEQIKRISAAKIVTPELYDVDGYPVDGGLMDLRLGAIDPGVRCRTCGGRLKECLGHPGMIELSRPVIHVKYLQIIEICLRAFCQHCGKFLLTGEKSEEYNNLKERIKKEETPAGLTKKEHLINIVYEELVKFLGENKSEIKITKKPTKIMLIGLLGNGKTTTASKLAKYFKK